MKLQLLYIFLLLCFSSSYIKSLTIIKNNLLEEGQIYEYDYNEDESYIYIDSLSPGNTYKFYIPGKKYDEFEISLRLDDTYISKKFDITVYELYEKNTENPLKIINKTLEYNSEIKRHSCYYFVSENIINYICYEFKPTIDMRYKYIYLLYRCQPDFSIGLNIGETKMEKLLAHKYYYFCINSINYNDYFELEITHDNKFNESEPFYIRVYEYEQYFYFRPLKKYKFTLYYNSVYNTYFIRYKIQKEKTYQFAITTEPQYQMENVSIKLTRKYSTDYIFDIASGDETNIKTLYPSQEYKFYLQARSQDIIEVEITKISDFVVSAMWLKFLEYYSRSSSEELKQKNTEFKYDKHSETYKATYVLKDNSAYYLAFEIHYPYYSNDVSIKAKKVQEGNINIDNNLGLETGLFMSKKITYKFYSKIQSNQLFNFEFRADFGDSLSQKVIIYEYLNCSNLDNPLTTKTDYLYCKISRFYYDYYLQYNYKIQNTRTNCFALEIKPNTDHYSVDITTNIWEEYDLKSDKVLNIENINGKAYLLYGFSDIYGAIDINIETNTEFSEVKDFLNLVIYEHEERNSYIACWKEYIQLPYNKETNSYSYSYQRICPYDYIAIDLYGFTKLNNVKVKVHLPNSEEEERKKMFIIIGGSAGAVVIIVIIIIIIVCCVKKKKKNEIPNMSTQSNKPLYQNI